MLSCILKHTATKILKILQVQLICPVHPFCGWSTGVVLAARLDYITEESVGEDMFRHLKTILSAVY